MKEQQAPQNPKEETFSFPKTELEILKFWQDKQIFQKSLALTAGKAPYIFYDGPPFATGLPHHGHLLASVIKDIIPRYFTMKGRYVSRRFGWDCHGLPIEHEIDKKLGMSALDAVKTLGVKGYNDECRGIVQRYTSQWQTTISRLGRWVDFENDYKTMDPSFMESVWWAFKQLWDQGLIYQGIKVVPFSTALGTVLSNFEASSNYQDVQDPAITILFKLKDEDAYLAAWTTTPWTLPSNLALCVNKNLKYSLVQDASGINIYFASDRLDFYQKNRKKKFTVVKEVAGTDLVGRKYEPLFPYFAHFAAEGAFQVLADDYVSAEDGTGIVHIAPDFGEDDWRVMKEHNLNVHACPVNDQGIFTKEVTDFVGIYVKEADKNVINWLKDHERFYDQDTITHSYPFCPRSDTPLIYKAIPSWYVKVEILRERLLAVNKEINWVPAHIKEGRFGKWLAGARDWAISRNRVWGTPLPIWVNKTNDKMICVGSIAELEKLTGKKVTDLHREVVDELSFTIPGEEGEYLRVPEVLDCWFESGSMPYAQLHYPFENQKMFKQGFPAEFIAEGLDQTRGWFYTLTVLAVAIFNRPAFKNVIVNGMVTAADGKKMSKRLRNYTPPDTLMENYGADALRLYLITSGLVKAEEQRFSDDGVKDMARRALLPWFNAFKFFQTYAEVDHWSPQEHLVNPREGVANISDRSILSQLQTLKKNIATEMEAYHLYNVVPQLLTFIENLTNWYIRLNRPRFWGEGLTDDKKAAYSTLYQTLLELSQTMAPFTPFLSEYLYQELRKMGDTNLPESVHLCTYPLPDKALIDPKLEDAINRMYQVILLGRQARIQAQIKVKVPLTSLTIIHKDQKVLHELKKLEEYIRSELNVKMINYTAEEKDFIKLFAKPNAPVLGKRLGKDFAKFRKIISDLTPTELSDLENNGSINLSGQTFTLEDILVYRQALPGGHALSNKFISIELDTSLNAELISEGLAREIINRIQKTRKELGLKVDDRIEVHFQGDPGLEEAMANHQNYISRETLAVQISPKLTHPEEAFSYEIENQIIRLNVFKVDA